MRIPMRIASVPVVAYLSFLASNSPMANDFIALQDHLHPLTQYQNLNPNKPRNKKTLSPQKILKRHSLGHFLGGWNSFHISVMTKSEASETTAWSSKTWKINKIENSRKRELEKWENVTHAVGRLRQTVAEKGRSFGSWVLTLRLEDWSERLLAPSHAFCKPPGLKFRVRGGESRPGLVLWLGMRAVVEVGSLEREWTAIFGKQKCSLSVLELDMYVEGYGIGICNLEARMNETASFSTYLCFWTWVGLPSTQILYGHWNCWTGPISWEVSPKHHPFLHQFQQTSSFFIIKNCMLRT